jgi:hypothetical protein
MNEFRLLSTSGILGYGFPEASLRAGLERKPDMIGVDGGSVDPGPHYLGSGKPFCSTMAIRRDLRLMLHAAMAHKIPMLIGTCGGAGGEPHLQLVAALVRDIAREEGLHFKLAVIHAEQPKGRVKERIREGRVRPLARRPPLDEATVDRAERIVGMMGPEPFVRALDDGAQIVLAGRSTDPAPFAAAAMRAQMPPAQSWYAGKMLECGATASVPKGHDCLFVTVREDHVEVEPLNPIRRCTPLSVANHSLHENASPIHHLEPGGMLDTENCRFAAISDRAVRVDGMHWHPAETYTVKLEGVEKAGHRAITICGTRDPLLIGGLDDFLAAVRRNIAEKAADIGANPEHYRLVIRSYGRDGVMDVREPARTQLGHELGFVVEVVADDQEVANAVVAIARANMLHTDFPGRLCREGNMAFPFSPSDIEMGPMYRFSVFHTVAPDDPFEMFPIEHETV